jgi:serine/threonine protein kinase
MNRKIIGEGAYGCVHKPSLHCKKSPKPGFSYDNYVSKFMATQNARDELKEFLVIGRLDDKNEYHLGTPILCSPKLDNIEDISKCKHININDVRLKPNNYSLLVIKYGGPDLNTFCMNYLDDYLSSDTQLKSDIFWLSVHKLLKGLHFFRTNNIVHNDLKPQNILFNMETGDLMYIDFGLMRSKTKIINSSKQSDNFLGIFHWSYPFDCGFMNKKYFDLYKNGTNEIQTNIYNSLTNMIISGEINTDNTKPNSNPYKLPIKRPNAFNLVFTYINPELVEPDSITKYSYLNDFFNNLKHNINTLTFEHYLNKTTDSIDIYGLGFTLQFVLNHFYKKNAINIDFFTRCSGLFRKMYNFNPFIRELNIENLLNEYENILLETGLLVRMNKTFINHIIEDRLLVPTDIVEEYKEELISPPKPITRELSRVAELDPPRLLIEKSCPEGKELNPKTNRCVNKCKSGYERNVDFKCIKTRKAKSKSRSKSIRRCPEGKELNPKTNRCVNKCKPGYERNANFKCIKTRKLINYEIIDDITNSSKEIDFFFTKPIKRCPEDKELNPRTNRCVNKCKPGYERNTDFKCVKIKI